jgi:hypothetical protein
MLGSVVSGFHWRYAERDGLIVVVSRDHFHGLGEFSPARVDLGAIDRNFIGRVDADAYPVPFHRDDGNADVSVDDDLFAGTTG